MPNIRIFESDNTGANPVSNQQVVFIPGSVKPLVECDVNGCVYISADTSIKDIFSKPSAEEKRAEETVAYVEYCLKWGLDVIYCYMSEGITEDSDFSYLLDKNNYNVKFITTGVVPSVKVITESGESDTKFVFDFALANRLMLIASTRKDCVVLADIDKQAYTIFKSGNVVSGDAVAEALDKYIKDGEGGVNLATESSSYGAIILPIFTCSLSSMLGGSGNYDMPGSFAYLYAFSNNCLKNNLEWHPAAGVIKGSVAALGSSKYPVSKYLLDTAIIKDKEGVSFNSVSTVRPYGEVIWGDRTLLKQTTSVKATSFLSIRNLISDIAKRAYETSIRYTYESNNDVTWLNYRTAVVELLDQMVASGVLQRYDIKKGVADTYNKIVCIITCYVNLPVENFDIYINLENAEVTTSEDEK